MRQYEYPRTHRLLRPGDFRLVFNNAAFKAQHAALLLLAKPNTCGHPRLGFVIAKRNVKLATARNCLKRVMREQFRLQQGSLPGVDLVIVARRPLADLDNVSLAGIFIRLLQKIRQQYDRKNPSKQIENPA